MKETVKVIVVAVLFAAAVTIGAWASWAHWSECRRLHPWWYCARQM